MTLEERAKRLIEEALRLTEEGKFEQALKIYEELYTENLPEAFNNAGNVYRRMGLLGRAVEMYRKAILADPTYPVAYFNLACALMEMDKYHEAVMFLEKAESLGLKNFELDVQLALCYIATGNTKKAKERLRDKRVKEEVMRFIEGEGLGDEP